MESTFARDLDRRLADLVRNERHLAVQFVIQLAGFAKRELYRELGYTSLFHYCVRQLGLSKSSAFRRSEVARLIARFPVIADRLAEGRLSIRALVELREVLTEENHAGVLIRAEGKSQEEAQLLAVEYRPRPIPRDVVRALPMPPGPGSSAPSGPTAPSRSIAPSDSFGPPAPSALPAPLGAGDSVPAETESFPLAPEVVKPLTPELRRLNVTVTADFIDELEQVRVALSHQCPDGNFEKVVRETFKLVLERDRKRKGLTHQPRAPTDRLRSPTDRPRVAQSETPGENDRYVPAAVKRTVWERDQGRCTWPMGDGRVCGSRHQLEFDHDLEVAFGGKPTVDNVRLLCKRHNLMKAEQRFGKAFMAKFRKDYRTARSPRFRLAPAEPAGVPLPAGDGATSTNCG
jgi:5-methylcytosine-specific restriction endonuclease McrA